MIYYHGQVTGPGGQLYQCEHNHRTETAAITCANSSGTRQMAAIRWQRAADQAVKAAELAKLLSEEREAARVRQIADRAASEARQAAAEAAIQQAKAAKRAAKLAAMTPRRAWKHMTSAERLLRTADLEMQVYGEITSADALTAYEARAAKPAAPPVPTPSKPAPSKPAPPKPPTSPRTDVAETLPVTPGSAWRQGGAVRHQPQNPPAPPKPSVVGSVVGGILFVAFVTFGVLIMIFLLTHASG